MGCFECMNGYACVCVYNTVGLQMYGHLHDMSVYVNMCVDYVLHLGWILSFLLLLISVLWKKTL